MGEMEPDEGEFKWGVTTSQSYFPSDNSKYFDGVDLSLVIGSGNTPLKLLRRIFAVGLAECCSAAKKLLKSNRAFGR